MVLLSPFEIPHLLVWPRFSFSELGPPPSIRGFQLAHSDPSRLFPAGRPKVTLGVSLKIDNSFARRAALYPVTLSIENEILRWYTRVIYIGQRSHISQAMPMTMHFRQFFNRHWYDTRNVGEIRSKYWHLKTETA